jgi:hypothetical protein
MLLCFLSSFLSLVLPSTYIIQLIVTLVFFSLSLHHHLVQLIRFLVVELTHSGLNPKFDMNLYLRLIILLVGDNVYIDSETLLVADFVNFKIKSAQSFKYAHRDMVCVRVFIGMSDRTCMSICVCTVFLKKISIALVFFLPVYTTIIDLTISGNEF